MVTIVILILMGPGIELFNHGLHSQNIIISQCTPPPLLRKKTCSLWPLKVIPLTLLPPDSASASPQSLGHLEPSFPTISHLILVILPSSLLPLNMLS
ncbi:hypothetical protein B0F90DRAFT_1776931 [Multifurca ochricompacta]|uniref:Uncharacterized protein n=1 Tax=Multifurca ochricompacta TaxID=376703 RepID=A0AAD4LV75_9AGAM|nr:hypothetical protein B0F90DRAFT_1776931 [Multifurca ochricompacta]